MDIITHAVVGAITGATMGHPIIGAVAAVVPDSALWLGRRPARPPALYSAAHGLLAPCLFAAITMALFGPLISAVVFFSWLSHIVLDIPTHEGEWSPRLFWPDTRPVFAGYEEWEWFNEAWWFGLLIAGIWSITCVVLYITVIGFQFLHSAL